MGAHTTSDDPTKYRLADELEHWRLKDPIERVRAYLSRTGGHDEGFFAEVDAEAADYASELRARCLALPDPHMLDMFDHVYAEQTTFLAAEKARYADYLESFEEPSLSMRQRRRELSAGPCADPVLGRTVRVLSTPEASSRAC